MDFQQESQNRQKEKRFHWTNANRSPNEEVELREYKPLVPAWADKLNLKTNVYNLSLELQSQTQLVIIDRILHRINEVDEAQPIDSNCSVSDNYFYDSPTHHVLCWTSLSKKSNTKKDKDSKTINDQQNEPNKNESGLLKTSKPAEINEDSLSKSSDNKNNSSTNKKNPGDSISNLDNTKKVYIPKYDYENDKPEDIRRMANTNFDYKQYVVEHQAKNKTLPLKVSKPNSPQSSIDSANNKETLKLKSVDETQNKNLMDKKHKEAKMSQTKKPLDADKNKDPIKEIDLLRQPSSQISERMRDSLQKMHLDLLEENQKDEKYKKTATESTNESNKNATQSKVPDEVKSKTEAMENKQKKNQNDEKSFSEQSNELLDEIKEKRSINAKLNNKPYDTLNESNENNKKNKKNLPLPKEKQEAIKNTSVSTNNQPKNEILNSRVSISNSSFDENSNKRNSSTNLPSKENVVFTMPGLNSKKENEEKTDSKINSLNSKLTKTISESNQNHKDPSISSKNSTNPSSSNNEKKDSFVRINKQKNGSDEISRKEEDQATNLNEQIPSNQEKVTEVEHIKSTSWVKKDAQDLPQIVKNLENERKSEQSEKLLIKSTGSSSKSIPHIVSNETKRESTVEKGFQSLDKLNGQREKVEQNQEPKKSSLDPTSSSNRSLDDKKSTSIQTHQEDKNRFNSHNASQTSLQKGIKENKDLDNILDKEGFKYSSRTSLDDKRVPTTRNEKIQQQFDKEPTFKSQNSTNNAEESNHQLSEPNSVENISNDETTDPEKFINSQEHNKINEPKPEKPEHGIPKQFLKKQDEKEKKLNDTLSAENNPPNPSSSLDFSDTASLLQDESKRKSNHSSQKEVQDAKTNSSNQTVSKGFSKILSSSKPMAPVKPSKRFNDLPITNQIFLKEESEEKSEHLDTLISNRTIDNESLKDATFSETIFRSIHTQTDSISSSSSQNSSSLKSSSSVEIIRVSSFPNKMESFKCNGIKEETHSKEPEQRKIKQTQQLRDKTENDVPKKQFSSSQLESQPSFSLQADSILQDLKKNTVSRQNVNIWSTSLSKLDQDSEKQRNEPLNRSNHTIALDERQSRVKSAEISPSFGLNKQQMDISKNRENHMEVKPVEIELPVKARNRQVEHLLIPNRLVKADSIEYNIPTNRTIKRKSKQNEIKEDESKPYEKKDSSETELLDSKFRSELFLLKQERDKTRSSTDEGYNESNPKDLAQIDSIVIDDTSIDEETHFDSDSDGKLVSKNSDNFMEKLKKHAEELQELEQLEKSEKKRTISPINKPEEILPNQRFEKVSRRDSLLVDQILNPKFNSIARDEGSEEEGMFYKEPTFTSRPASGVEICEKNDEHLNKKLLNDVNLLLENLKKERERIKKSDSLNFNRTKQTEQLKHGSPKLTASEKNLDQGYIENITISPKEHRSPSLPQAEDLNSNSSSMKKEIDENKRRFRFLKKNSSSNFPKDKKQSSQRLISYFK